MKNLPPSEAVIRFVDKGDSLSVGERSASTSNRNFRGRQGVGSRTHLVSPAMAAAASVSGHFVDVRELMQQEI